MRFKDLKNNYNPFIFMYVIDIFEWTNVEKMIYIFMYFNYGLR
jgi:hypothetical protein